MPLQTFSEALRGQYQTGREFPVENGQTVELYQVLAKKSNGKLVPYDSADPEADKVFGISLRADVAVGDFYLDYVTQADWFNGPKLVFANPADAWQKVAEAFRAIGIRLRAFNPAENINLEEDEESESEA